jgi:uncharacterized protein YggT (Ycf19 family)
MGDPLRSEPGMEDLDEVVERPSGVRHLHAVPTARYRAVRFVWLVAGVINVLIGIRFVLQLLAASQSAPFVNLVYRLSTPLVAPFHGIFPAIGQRGFVLDPAALVALVVYALIAAGFTRLIRVTSRGTYADLA